MPSMFKSGTPKDYLTDHTSHALIPTCAMHSITTGVIMEMRACSEEGLLLEAKIVSDGRIFHLDCRIEEGPKFRYGSFRNIEKALKGMTMFFTNSPVYRS